MLASTELRLEEIRLQNEINDLPEVRLADDRANAEEYETAERRRSEGVRALAEVRKQIIEALRKEDAEAQAAMANNPDTSGWTAEMREFHRLGQRTSMAEYMRAGFQQRAVAQGTPEHEYNQHVFGNSFGPGEYPLEMLLDRQEHFSLEAWEAAQVMEADEERTAITGTAADAGMLTFVDRLFADSEGAYLMARYPAVGPGRHSYPIVTGTGNVGAVIARDTAESVAGGITVNNADPNRIQHSFEVARVDEVMMPGIMEYMVRDIRGGLMDGLDDFTIDQLFTGLSDADIQSGATLTAAGLMQGIAEAVNGRSGYSLTDMRVLAGNTSATNQTTAYARIGALFATDMPDGMFNILANIRASAHFAAASGGEDHIIIAGTRGNRPRLIVPVWRRGEILRDRGRLQLRDVVTLTGVMYADAIVAATDTHFERSVETQ